MSAEDITITATYKTQMAYKMTLHDGAGGVNGNYTESTKIPAHVSKTLNGQVFDKWIADCNVNFGDATANDTYFIMPEQDVTVTATYKTVSGSSGGNNSSNDNTTTESVQSTDSSTHFADVPSYTYYADAVNWAAQKGITTGTSATTFSPDAPCTRAQIMTFLYRDMTNMA